MCTCTSTYCLRGITNHSGHRGSTTHGLPTVSEKGGPSTYSLTKRRVPELIPVLGSQPAGDVSHKPGSRLPLLSARPAVTLATLKRAATNFAVGELRHDGCGQFA